MSIISFVANILTKFLALSTSANSGKFKIDSTLLFNFLFSLENSYFILSQICSNTLENFVSSFDITLFNASCKFSSGVPTRLVFNVAVSSSIILSSTVSVSFAKQSFTVPLFDKSTTKSSFSEILTIFTCSTESSCFTVKTVGLNKIF